MIKKTILFTVFLLVLWSLIIKWKPWSVVQHQWQENVIVAEKYLFDHHSKHNVIVGSSLSRRLFMDSLPDFYSLALNGQGVFEGLSVIKNVENLPKNIFIEINVIDRHENQHYQDIVSSSFLNKLKSHFPMFRTDKQPIGFASNILNVVIKKANKNYIEKNKLNKGPLLIFDELLVLREKVYSAPIDTQKIDKQFQMLSYYVQLFKARNVNVVFYEMPVHPHLTMMNKAVYIRNRIITEYPENKFIQLPDNIVDYTTSDGLHLTNEESKLYTVYFKNELKTINEKSKTISYLN